MGPSHVPAAKGIPVGNGQASDCTRTDCTGSLLRRPHRAPPSKKSHQPLPQLARLNRSGTAPWLARGYCVQRRTVGIPMCGAGEVWHEGASDVKSNGVRSYSGKAVGS
eukprot:365782-Chlamydomonas_euryale.AAC.7